MKLVHVASVAAGMVSVAFVVDARQPPAPSAQSAAPLSPAELATIRERHKRHIVFDPQ
jgi:hypothetical protein